VSIKNRRGGPECFGEERTREISCRGSDHSFPQVNWDVGVEKVQKGKKGGRDQREQIKRNSTSTRRISTRVQGTLQPPGRPLRERIIKVIGKWALPLKAERVLGMDIRDIDAAVNSTQGKDSPSGTQRVGRKRTQRVDLCTWKERNTDSNNDGRDLGTVGVK